VEAWAKESGAIFEADKTGLIHLTSPAKARWDAVETAETAETAELAASLSF
jgi:C4-dicarboxylate-specific signal transduction histidine kinase